MEKDNKKTHTHTPKKQRVIYSPGLRNSSTHLNLQSHHNNLQSISIESISFNGNLVDVKISRLMRWKHSFNSLILSKDQKR